MSLFFLPSRSSGSWDQNMRGLWVVEFCFPELSGFGVAVQFFLYNPCCVHFGGLCWLLLGAASAALLQQTARANSNLKSTADPPCTPGHINRTHRRRVRAGHRAGCRLQTFPPAGSRRGRGHREAKTLALLRFVSFVVWPRASRHTAGEGARGFHPRSVSPGGVRVPLITLSLSLSLSSTDDDDDVVESSHSHPPPHPRID